MFGNLFSVFLVFKSNIDRNHILKIRYLIEYIYSF